MKNKKIVVFGANGFIGSYLIDHLLNHNFDVVAIDFEDFPEKKLSDQIEYLVLDVKKKSDFSKIKSDNYDVIVHLAALQPANYNKQNTPEDYIHTNLLGTLNILDFCKKNNVKKIIYAMSHRNTSGHWDKIEVIKEIHGRSQEYVGEYAMFSISESAAFDCVQYYSLNYGISNICLRLPPVYGYGPHLSIFKDQKPIKTGFQTFIEQAQEGKPITIWGDPNIGRDIIYVKDVVSAIHKSIESELASGVYNISSSYPLTLLEEVLTIIDVFSKNDAKSEINFLPDKPHSIDRFVYDNTKAKNDLDWSPQFNFKEMLLDYKKELNSKKYEFLIHKRKKLFKK